MLTFGQFGVDVLYTCFHHFLYYTMCNGCTVAASSSALWPISGDDYTPESLCLERPDSDPRPALRGFPPV